MRVARVTTVGSIPLRSFAFAQDDSPEIGRTTHTGHYVTTPLVGAGLALATAKS